MAQNQGTRQRKLLGGIWLVFRSLVSADIPQKVESFHGNLQYVIVQHTDNRSLLRQKFLTPSHAITKIPASQKRLHPLRYTVISILFLSES
jgi:hypothetical protein